MKFRKFAVIGSNDIYIYWLNSLAGYGPTARRGAAARSSPLKNRCRCSFDLRACLWSRRSRAVHRLRRLRARRRSQGRRPQLHAGAQARHWRCPERLPLLKTGTRFYFPVSPTRVGGPQRPQLLNWILFYYSTLQRGIRWCFMTKSMRRAQHKSSCVWTS